MSRLHLPLRSVALLGCVTSLGLAACGGASASDTTAPSGSDAVVRAQAGITWDQSSITASAHDGKVVVTLINDSSQPHNLHIVDGDGNDADPSAKELAVEQSGDSDTGTFSLAPGEYRVVCQIPGHSNMSSTLTVS